MNFKTDQEQFWAGSFGDGYMSRNSGERQVVNSMVRFSKILRSTAGVVSIAELGCNVGANLSALKRLNPAFDLSAYEINDKAAEVARSLGVADVNTATVTEEIVSGKMVDLTFTSGVLIHINPESLRTVYKNLFSLTRRYIAIDEYYSPTPVSVEYRGEKDRLFKRDFAGELMDQFNLRLVDYGFTYHRDNYFPGGDSNWFLLEKQ